MATAIPTRWEVQSGGSDTANSGGFRAKGWIAAPAAPTVAASSGGSVANATYYCVITYNDANGETVISGESSVVSTGSNQTITVTSPPALTGAKTWSAYFGTVTGGPYFPQGTGLTIGTDRVVTTTPPTTGTQPCGVDYSIASTSPNISDTHASTDGTTTITDTSVTFTGAHVGNVAKLGSLYYDIVSVTDSTHIVVDRTITTGSSQTLIIGGPFATPGQAASVAAGTGAGDIILIKQATYTIANGTVNTAGNKISTNGVSVIGYNTNRNPGNTDATQPILNANANSMTVCTFNGNNVIVANLDVEPNGKTSVTGISIAGGQYSLYRDIKVGAVATPFATGGTSNTFQDIFLNAPASGFTGSPTTPHLIRCFVLSNTSGAAFSLTVSGAAYYDHCIAANAKTHGFTLTNGSICTNCAAYNSGISGNAGFNLPATANGVHLINCIAWGNSNSQFGVELVTNIVSGLRIENFAAGGNTTDVDYTWIQTFQVQNQTGGTWSNGYIVLTGDPFTSAAGNDFSLNNTAGAGAACRAAGIPGAIIGSATTGYLDLGVAQSRSTFGAGGTIGSPIVGAQRMTR